MSAVNTVKPIHPLLLCFTDYKRAQTVPRTSNTNFLAIAHALLLLRGRREENFCPVATRWSEAKTVHLISLVMETHPFHI